ncbi:PEP-CTERM sorting domain-containing protein [Roseateles oligotrophus]|uniref:PEP-CTERM sorting domain-containing protein n=1 Tax=Roseateles oligotrophus TaxID=1769250 RepID=A0ABT2YBV9_9BURK|nr:PEP-CTERM sorting domain-containing protein [Roseateles oligotrophus]MCV2366680.1 PEP-CTERM sorting domain-containing protein [Roseateles oligotrophus]
MFANKKAIALAVLTMSMTGIAVADSLDLKFVGKDSETILTTSFATAYPTGRLEFRTTQSNASFYAYCVELVEDHAVAGDGFQTYTVGKFDGVQATRLNGLFSSSYAGLASATDRAAFQTAIWEITHETEAVMDVSKGAGDFSVTNLADPLKTEGFVFQVNSFLGKADAYAGQDLYTLTKLTSNGFQDLLTVTAVPEPSGFALMAVGLAGFGLLARRRKNKQG